MRKRATSTTMLRTNAGASSQINSVLPNSRYSISIRMDVRWIDLRITSLFIVIFDGCVASWCAGVGGCCFRTGMLRLFSPSLHSLNSVVLRRGNDLHALWVEIAQGQ